MCINKNLEIHLNKFGKAIVVNKLKRQRVNHKFISLIEFNSLVEYEVNFIKHFLVLFFLFLIVISIL